MRHINVSNDNNILNLYNLLNDSTIIKTFKVKNNVILKKKIVRNPLKKFKKTKTVRVQALVTTVLNHFVMVRGAVPIHDITYQI